LPSEFVLIGFILFICLLNLALGYGCALALADQPLGPMLAWRKLPRLPALRLPKLRLPPRRPATQAVPAESVELPPAAAESPAATAPAATEPAEGPESPAAEIAPLAAEPIPPAWIEKLTPANLETDSLAEAAAHMTRLVMSDFREALLLAEWNVREALTAVDGVALLQARGDLKAEHERWLAGLDDLSQALGERHGGWDSERRHLQAIEQSLAEQAAQVPTAQERLDAIDFQLDATLAGRQLLEEIGRQMDLVHVFRDHLDELLATVLRDGGRLAELSRALQYDSATDVLNRHGIEVLLHEWWRDDPQRTRAVSLVAVDVDRFRRVNERLGTTGGDRALKALAQLLLQLVRRGRGFDRVARLSGQSFLLFLGDTGSHNATCAIERIRQTLEATTFDCRGNEFELTLSCGVVSVGPQETTAELLARLADTLREAKKGGRNRTALDEGLGAQVIASLSYQVKAESIPVQAP
jgi:diguanylate cyclase (GGDEF)-like protein